MNDRSIQLVIGLGNPGEKYKNTRHNAGFIWLDNQFPDIEYEFDKYGNFEYSLGEHNNSKIILLKPQTFMNKSGESVIYAMKRFEVGLNNILVIHDEFDLEIGEYKISCSRGHGGHNGIKSINQILGTNEYCRLRLGVRPAELTTEAKADQVVLSNFRPEELQAMKTISLDVLKDIIN